MSVSTIMASFITIIIDATLNSNLVHTQRPILGINYLSLLLVMNLKAVIGQSGTSVKLLSLSHSQSL